MIYRVERKEKPFVLVDKGFINDERLSFKEKGILLYFLSKPDKWEFFEEEIASHSRDGISAVKAGIKKLIECGYIVRGERIRNDKGQLGAYEYIVKEVSTTCENPTQEKPTLENPTQENHTASNNNINNNNKSKNDCIKYISSILKGIVVDDNARQAQMQVVNKLSQYGFNCQLERPVDNRGDGRTGRINIFATKEGIDYAIEIDWQSPREKSIYKLKQFSNAKKIILLRGGKSNPIDGIDLVQTLEVNSSSPDLAKSFETFYKAYPKHKSRGTAEKAWRTLKPTDELLAKIMKALETAKKSSDWTKDNGQYIPYPATWLRAKGWEDETEKTDVSKKLSTYEGKGEGYLC